MNENKKYKDNGGRLIFENATLCSQFLREYTEYELFKDLKPEDIEDMTERFLPMFSEERDSDVVKKVRLHDRIFLSDVFGNCVPDYTYNLFKLQDCKDAELISRNDEISFIMLINKLRSFTDFYNLEFPDNYFEDISKKTTGDVLIVIARLIESYLRQINLPDEEIYDLTDRIKEGNMSRLFEHFEGYDIQQVRRDSRMEGREEGRDILLIKLVSKKLVRGKSPEAIADEIEESVDIVNEIIDAIESTADEGFDEYKVLEAWKHTVKAEK